MSSPLERSIFDEQAAQIDQLNLRVTKYAISELKLRAALEAWEKTDTPDSNYNRLKEARRLTEEALK